MTMRGAGKATSIAATVMLLTSPVLGQTLYSVTFDNDTTIADWNINYGADTNVTVGGTKNEVPTFNFDYSTLGIPPAPSQTGTSTRGMQLKARLNSTDPVTGISVSPKNQSFTGDYVLTFDLWSNFNGGLDGTESTSGDPGLWDGGVGSTIFSNYGILSNGGANYQTGSTLGVAEALFFSNTGDGQNGFDYRVHGPARPGGFRATVESSAYNPALDGAVTFADAYPANHPQGGEGLTNRGVFTDLDVNDTDPPIDETDGELYRAAFPSVSAPGQEALYPFQQFGQTMQGALGMAWRQVEIKKVGNIVTWSVLNSALEGGRVLLATVDLSLTTVGTGTNIMFGHADGITGVSTDPNWETLQFTLIDNVKVEAIETAEDDADFDGDGDVDGADFLTWQRGVGINDGSAGLADGDADNDGNVNAADLDIWKNQFVASTGAAAAVPEPGSVALAGLAIVGVLGVRRRRS